MYLGTPILRCLGMHFERCGWYHVKNGKHSHFLKHSAEPIHATQNLNPNWCTVKITQFQKLVKNDG